MRAPYRFTLSLRTARDEPGELVTAFTLCSTSAEAFARSLGLPWPTDETCFRRGTLEIAVERHEHTHRPPQRTAAP
jgi:hypothetical protein